MINFGIVGVIRQIQKYFFWAVTIEADTEMMSK